MPVFSPVKLSKAQLPRGVLMFSSAKRWFNLESWLESASWSIFTGPKIPIPNTQTIVYISRLNLWFLKSKPSKG